MHFGLGSSRVEASVFIPPNSTALKKKKNVLAHTWRRPKNVRGL